MQDIILAVKAAIGSNWLEVLSRYFDPVILDKRKEHPCPKCGGTTRFAPFKDVESTGGVTCRHCFTHGADGIAAVAWLMGCSQIDAAKRIAADIGLDLSPGARPSISLDVIDHICRAKHMPRVGLEQFGPLEACKYGREKIDAIKVPVYNERGEQHSHFFVVAVGKGFCQRGKGMDGLFLPGRLPKSGEEWLLTEGVKDAAALASLGFAVCGMPTSFLAAKYALLFRGCRITIVPDLDQPSMRGSKRSGSHLAGIATEIKVARLPGELLESKGDGVRESLQRFGEPAIRAAIAAAEPWTPVSKECDERPEILVTLDEGKTADRVIDALKNLGHASNWIPIDARDDVAIYQRGSMLCQTMEVESDDGMGVRRIRPLPEPILRERITQACRLIEDRSTDKEAKFVAVQPPRWLVAAIHCRGYFPTIRHLVGCVDTPVIRLDGSVLEQPGYDLPSRLLYKPRCTFPAIGTTFEEAAAAATQLEEVVCDFPFKTGADRSAWLALLLTLVGRPCITGCTPLFAVSANVRGAGKTILINAAHLIARGSMIAARAYDVDDREMKKSITSIAIEALPAVLIDNIEKRIHSASLDAALTSTVWSDRILGESRTTGDLPLKTVWTATGNNLAFGGDLGRRVLPIRLSSPEEKPEERLEFVHRDLFGWIRENRPRLVTAALTILRAYCAAGMPDQGGAWGSYEAWHRVVRGAILWTGWEDPMDTRVAMEESDDTASLLKLIIAGMHECDPYRGGLTAREIGCSVEDEPGKVPSLVEASAIICGQRFDARRFASRLRQFTGRVVGGESIACRQSHGGVKRWFVHVEGTIDPPGKAEQAILQLD